MTELERLEAAFGEAGGRGVELAEEIDRLRGGELMTIEQLKEMLSTYGVNDEERNAPVFVNINGVPTPITVEDSLVDYGSHPDDPAQGPFVLLRAVAHG